MSNQGNLLLFRMIHLLPTHIEAVENEMYNSMYDLICKETVIAVRPNVDSLSRLFSVSC